MQTICPPTPRQGLARVVVLLTMLLLGAFVLNACRTPSLTGKVRDVKGRPVSGASVLLKTTVRGDTLSVDCDETDRAGRFSCLELPDKKAVTGDRIELHIRKSGYAREPKVLELPVTEGLELELAFQEGEDVEPSFTPFPDTKVIPGSGPTGGN